VGGLRYGWDENPSGQQLYSFNGGGLPAMPFISSCTAKRCTLTPAGQVPPDTPSPSTKCSFHNNTAVNDATPVHGKSGQVEVPFLDEDACCGACMAHAGCIAAEMFGSDSKGPPPPAGFTSKCQLYQSAGSLTPFSCVLPCARVAITLTSN
jgi:hypothetical protein